MEQYKQVIAGVLGASAVLVAAYLSVNPLLERYWLWRLRSPDPEWRLRALASLESVGSEASVPAILDSLATAAAQLPVGTEWEVESHYGPHPPVFGLKRLFLRWQASSSRLALRCICSRRGVACLPALAKGLKHRDEPTRLFVGELIEAMGPSAFAKLSNEDQRAYQLLLESRRPAEPDQPDRETAE